MLSGIQEAKFLRQLFEEMSRGELLPKVTSGHVAVSAARSPQILIATHRPLALAYGPRRSALLPLARFKAFLKNVQGPVFNSQRALQFR
jgi:hypothetical protein